METTGERIKKARLAAGMTQEELAQRIGKKYSVIHKYEAGLVVNLKQETIALLADALQVKPSYLLCIDDDVSPTKQKLLDAVDTMDEEQLEKLLKLIELVKEM